MRPYGNTIKTPSNCPAYILLNVCLLHTLFIAFAAYSYYIKP